MFCEFEGPMLSNRQIIYKLFPEMNYFLQKTQNGKIMFFLKKLYFCAEKYLIILINQQFLLSMKHKVNAKDVKLEFGQIEIYFFPLNLIEHE